MLILWRDMHFAAIESTLTKKSHAGHRPRDSAPDAAGVEGPPTGPTHHRHCTKQMPIIDEDGSVGTGRGTEASRLKRSKLCN